MLRTWRHSDHPLQRKVERNVEQNNPKRNRKRQQIQNPWKIKTNTNKFTIIRLGANMGNQITIDDEIYDTKGEGKSIGL